jgi:hypothetical protein
MNSRYSNVMSPRNDVDQAILSDVFSETSEPLIAAAGDAGAEEEEDHRLKNSCLLFSRLKLSMLLLGLLLGFFLDFSVLETKMAVVVFFWDENHVTKSKTIFVVFSLFCGFFGVATLISSLRFLRKLVTINYRAARGCSKDLLEVIVLHVEYCFCVGNCLAWTMTGVMWGMPTQTGLALAMLVVVLFGYKIEMMPSSRQSAVEETMTAV